jgi:hypothetical protein
VPHLREPAADKKDVGASFSQRRHEFLETIRELKRVLPQESVQQALRRLNDRQPGRESVTEGH